LRTRDYEPEKIFICRISLGEWFGLREEFDLDGPRSERYAHILILLSLLAFFANLRIFY
jgi:hypothetical protein